MRTIEITTSAKENRFYFDYLVDNENYQIWFEYPFTVEKFDGAELKRIMDIQALSLSYLFVGESDDSSVVLEGDISCTKGAMEILEAVLKDHSISEAMRLRIPVRDYDITMDFPTCQRKLKDSPTERYGVLYSPEVGSILQYCLMCELGHPPIVFQRTNHNKSMPIIVVKDNWDSAYDQKIWTAMVFTPLVYFLGLKGLAMGNDLDDIRIVRYENQWCYHPDSFDRGPFYEQATSFLMTEAVGWPVHFFSVVSSLHRSQVREVLQKRYPTVAEQMSIALDKTVEHDFSYPKRNFLIPRGLRGGIEAVFREYYAESAKSPHRRKYLPRTESILKRHKQRLAQR